MLNVPMLNIPMLHEAAKVGVSAVHITVGRPPVYRLHGVLFSIDDGEIKNRLDLLKVMAVFYRGYLKINKNLTRLICFKLSISLIIFTREGIYKSEKANSSERRGRKATGLRQ